MSNEKMPFFDYIDQLNSNITSDNSLVIYKDEAFKKLKKKELQVLIYRNIYNRLENILLKMFKWTVPETFNVRAMELGLLHRGWLCAYKGPTGTWCLPCIPTNMYNIYGDPTQVRVYGFNGYNEVVNIDYGYESPQIIKFGAAEQTTNKGWFMRDNDTAYPYINYVRYYAYALTDKVLAFNTACQRMKMPFIWTVKDKELKDTVDKMVEKIEDNDTSVIVLKNNIDGQGLDNIRLEQPNLVGENVQAIKDSIVFDFNRFLETCGINTNPSPDKSQVVLTPELDSNNSLIDLEKDIRLKNREDFCEKCSSMGIQMSVELNIDEMQQEINKFGKEFEDGEKDDSSSGQQSD